MIYFDTDVLVNAALKQDPIKYVEANHFNDCLHTAIAEEHCTELYTYNHYDFKKIQLLTSLIIHIL